MALLPIESRLPSLSRMVTLDFEVDPEVVSHARTLDLASCDVTMLSHTLFLMRVRLATNGSELFNRESGILYMAYALDTVRQLPRDRFALLQPPGMGLLLRMDGEDVEVQLVGAGRSSRAPYSDLLQAWQVFTEKVRTFLVEEFPELRDNPDVGAWFRGEEEGTN